MDKMKTFKLPKNKVITVDDLLSSSDVNGLLEDVVKDKTNIKEMIIIYEDFEDGIHWSNTSMKMSKIIGLLEQVKMWMMMEE